MIASLLLAAADPLEHVVNSAAIRSADGYWLWSGNQGVLVLSGVLLIFVGLWAAGEGWHNNHHADPSSARHGHRWWEFDFSYLLIRIFELCGLVWDVKRPRPVAPQP